MVPALISFLRKFSIISALLTACLPSPCVGLNHPVNETKRSAALLGALEISAGVYHNQTDNPSLKKTVLITGCNHGYLPFLHNFKCFIDRLNLKLLVISMDHRTHSHIENKLSSTLKSFLWIGEQTVQESFATFRSPQFNVITHAKTSYTHAILSLGYDVIFIDLDIALVRDPLPYLFWEGVDYVFTHNKICPQHEKWNFMKSEEEGNTGFYYVRSNWRTIQLWKDTMLTALTPVYYDLDDQSVFWIQIRNSSIPSIVPMLTCADYNGTRSGNDLTACPLDGCMFSAGGLRGIAYDWIRENLGKRHEKAVSFHANYRKGLEEKKKDLADHGYWLATEQGCRDLKLDI